MRLAIVVLYVVLGCGGKKEDPSKETAKVEEAKQDEGGGALGKLGDLAGKAKEIGGDVAGKATKEAGDMAGKARDMAGRAEDMAGKARDMGGDVVGKAGSVSSELVDKAKDLAEKAGELSKEALTSGKDLKESLRGKWKLAGMDYDLAIDSAPESERDHKARIAGMKQIKVGDYTVGIAQDSKHPLGTVYKWQFRFTWRVPGGNVVRLALFTNEALPDLEAAADLLTIVQASETLLKLK
jgi:hypothetical protein